MFKKDDFKEEILKLISQNLGEYTASLYKEFFAGKGEKEILKLTKELLIELFGPKNAEKQLKILYKKFRINSLDILNTKQ